MNIYNDLIFKNKVKYVLINEEDISLDEDKYIQIIKFFNKYINQIYYLKITFYSSSDIKYINIITNLFNIVYEYDYEINELFIYQLINKYNFKNLFILIIENLVDYDSKIPYEYLYNINTHYLLVRYSEYDDQLYDLPYKIAEKLYINTLNLWFLDNQDINLYIKYNSTYTYNSVNNNIIKFSDIIKTTTKSAKFIA